MSFVKGSPQGECYNIQYICIVSVMVVMATEVYLSVQLQYVHHEAKMKLSVVIVFTLKKLKGNLTCCFNYQD